MNSSARHWTALLIIAGCCVLLGAAWAAAQDCTAQLNALWIAASNACIGKPAGYLCNGGSAPAAEPAGAVSSALASVGALVEVKAVDAFHTPAIDGNGTGGIAWLRLSDNIQMSALVLGDVAVQDVTPPDFPAWQSFIVQTNPQPPTCGVAPHNGFVAQSPVDQNTRVVINGVSLDLAGTLLVQTSDSDTTFAMLSGQLRVLALGQVQPLWAGEQVSVPHNSGDFADPSGAPNPPAPLDANAVRNLPTALLDRPILLPQPGYVATEGQVNLRTSPSKDAPLLIQVPPGQVLSVLGRNPDGTWYHVQLSDGETGWMFADLLEKNIGDINAVYEKTPLPPQRFGDLGQKAQVIAPTGANVRQAPDIAFGIVATLPFGTPVSLVARSPYSPWVKIQASGGIVGWLALISLQTEAVVDALPIDYNVPPPPAPTRVPGTYDNAFPDPNGK
jgi:uncharacterized protein YgiM (DUF1202 family)